MKLCTNLEPVIQKNGMVFVFQILHVLAGKLRHRLGAKMFLHIWQHLMTDSLTAPHKDPNTEKISEIW